MVCPMCGIWDIYVRIMCDYYYAYFNYYVNRSGNRDSGERLIYTIIQE